jgi:hypothetical protein
MLTRLEASEPTTDGLRRKGCLVWNTALVLMVSLAEKLLTGEPDALCGQLGYVVPSPKTVDSLGFSHSPHHIIFFK